ncbi:MAG TPA: MAPEG family protein [Croceibacterium sp.]
MNRDQKTVATGALSGIAAMLVSTGLLSMVLPSPAASSQSDAVLYALRWLPLAVLPLLAMIVSVGNARAMGPAIDPTLGAEDQAMRINIRAASNTLEQFALFAAGSLGLAASIPVAHVQVVGAAAIVFVAARIAFWIGYRVHPLYRAAGFAGTAYLNFGLIGAALYFAAAKAL